MVTLMWIGGYQSDSRNDYDSDGTRRGLWGISGGHALYGSGWLLGTCSDGLGDSNWEAELVAVLSVRSTCYGNSCNERCNGGSSFPLLHPLSQLGSSVGGALPQGESI
jgi:hypothetical protein